MFSEVKFYVHLRPVALLSNARPGRYPRLFFRFFLRKIDPQSSTYLKYLREHVFPDCDSFCPPF